ncbi:MAG TPA: tetratricopeptide repeat protein [Bryobacteraceae bacterium]|jgi:tetratricopeptide (TPR) repeat protein|nr:tetratricopeptide repeat protein [Bryobacteraceae bacterium]
MKVAGLILVMSYCMPAQIHQHAPPAAQPSVDLAKLPPPQVLEGIGHSHLVITTKSLQVQQWFDQGLALLHCFWDYEALRAFEEAVRLDADCAMCHWGVSQALNFRGGREEQTKAELFKAKDLAAKASDWEQRLIRAFAESEEKKGDEGRQAFDKEMAVLVDSLPDELEIRLMMAWHANRGYQKGDPSSGAIYSQAMLRSILREHPDNAAANHYWIHALEASSHPERALESAGKLAALAPASGHMVHMPGHIYYRVGDYERARQSFLAAKRVDEDYMARQHVSFENDWNYAHNLSYLVAACAEEGRYTEAREHARSLVGLANDPDQSGNPWFYVLQIGSTEARLAIRFADWDRTIANPMRFGVSDDRVSVWARGYRDGLIAYARGMKAADGRQFAAAEIESTSLQALLWRLSQEELDDKNKPDRDQVLKILGTASLELRGNIASGQGDLAAARKLLESADQHELDIGYYEPPQYSRPALEVLGAACLRAGKFSEAREAYQKALARRPHSGFALYGIALAWDEQGDKQHAAKAYREFLDAWSHADPDLPQIKLAKEYLSANPAAE